MKQSRNKTTNDLSQNIMAEIKKKKITIKSKSRILAESLGSAGIIILTLLLVILTLNIIMHTLFNLGVINYLGFGLLGFTTFLNSFPYIWLALAISLFVLASYLLKKYDLSYKKPYRLLITAILIFITIMSFTLAKSRTNDLIQTFISHHPLTKPLIRKNVFRNLKTGLIGTVTSITPNKLIVSSDNIEYQVILSPTTHYPYGQNFVVGDTVMIVGQVEDQVIQARGVRKLDANSPGSNPGSVKGLHRSR